MSADKPREWLICEPTHHTDGRVLPSDFSLFDGWKDPDYIHVIEKSAYDKLQAELEKARAENEELMKVDYWQDRYNIVLKERDALAAQLAEAAQAPPFATNTGWPHEKKLHERIERLERGESE